MRPLSLAVPRMNGGKKVPAPLQRMRADDLLAAAFPMPQRVSKTFRATGRFRIIRWWRRR